MSFVIHSVIAVEEEFLLLEVTGIPTDIITLKKDNVPIFKGTIPESKVLDIKLKNTGNYLLTVTRKGQSNPSLSRKINIAYTPEVED